MDAGGSEHVRTSMHEPQDAASPTPLLPPDEEGARTTAPTDKGTGGRTPAVHACLHERTRGTQSSNAWRSPYTANGSNVRSCASATGWFVSVPRFMLIALAKCPSCRASWSAP